ncbi:MAG TPA: hypothetical protein VLL05_16205 [Terriglobales bacterium]|nr:hypothetical protein [Terriglobales bacterium]
MNTRHLPCEIVRSVAGFMLAGAGFLLLTERVVSAVDRVSRVLDHTASARIDAVSWVMLASSLDARQLGHDLLRVLWPLLPSLVGTVLLWSARSRQGDRSNSNQPCMRWA